MQLDCLRGPVVMLLSFRMSNFLSIREEQEFSFLTSPSPRLADRTDHRRPAAVPARHRRRPYSFRFHRRVLPIR